MAYFNSMSRNPYNSTQSKKVFKKENIVLIMFLLFGFTSLLLGFLQFYDNKTMYKSDKKIISQRNNLKSLNNFLYNNPESSKLELQLIDTDKDGLTDYDELNRYNTSPYLEDTDSDGIPDKKEIEQGTDPTCPQGKDCGRSNIVKKESLNLGINKQTKVNVNDLPSDVGAVLKGDLDVATLRKLLVEQGGLSESEVNQIDDQTLKFIYQKVLKDVENKTSFNNLQNPYSQFENLTPDKIREMLIKGGVDADTVKNLSDEQVLDVYQQTLKELKTNSKF